MIRKLTKRRNGKQHAFAKREARSATKEGKRDNTLKISEGLVEQAFGQLDTGQAQIAQSFISLLDERLRRAEQTAERGVVAFILCWATTYLVAKGFIAEATVGGMKINKIQSLLIASPLTLGYLSYRFSAALSSAMTLFDIIRAWYRNFLPKLGETGLDTLLSSDSLVGAEEHEVLTKRSRMESTLSQLILISAVFFVWGGTLAAIVHAAYMLVQMAQWPRAAVATITLVALVLWLRGASMIYHRTSTD